MTLPSQMTQHLVVLKKVRKETLRKPKGKGEIKSTSLQLTMKYSRGQTNAQIGKWLQMRDLLRAQRMTKWERNTHFPSETGYLQLLTSWGFASDSFSTGGHSCFVPSICVLTASFSLLKLDPLFLKIGTLVLCYKGFWKRLFFLQLITYSVQYIYPKLKGPES